MIDVFFSLLFQLVADEGGFDIVCQDRHWTKIAVQMGFSPGKAVGSHLRGHYEKILYPYNLFQSGANLLVSGALCYKTESISAHWKRLWVICTNMRSSPSILSRVKYHECTKDLARELPPLAYSILECDFILQWLTVWFVCIAFHAYIITCGRGAYPETLDWCSVTLWTGHHK